MNPESSLNAMKRCLLCRSRQLAGFLPFVLCFFFPYDFLTLLSEITFLLSSPHSSDPSLIWLRDAVGSGEETAPRQEEEKARALVVGNNVPVVSSA